MFLKVLLTPRVDQYGAGEECEAHGEECHGHGGEEKARNNSKLTLNIKAGNHEADDSEAKQKYEAQKQLNVQVKETLKR